MRPDEIDPLLTRAAGGDAEALALLIARADHELRVLVADHAVSTAMVDEVLTAVWEEACPRLSSAPRGLGFAAWLWDIARDILARALHERDRVATENKDPIAHALTRAALEGLDRGYADEVAGLAAFKRAVEALEPATQALLRRRYGEGARAEAMAQALGQPASAVTAALFRARAASRGNLEGAESLMGVDPLFAALVEDFLADALIPDARTLLAGSVTKDLEYHAAFDVQTRADLVLSAMHAPPSLEAARALAQAVMPAARTSGRQRPARGSDRTSRISDGRRRVSSASLAAVPTSGSRPASGRQPSTGSHRRTASVETAPPTPAGGGAPWTLIGIAAVVLAIVVGLVATRGGGEPRPAPRPTVATPAPPRSPQTGVVQPPPTPVHETSPTPRTPAMLVDTSPPRPTPPAPVGDPGPTPAPAPAPASADAPAVRLTTPPTLVAGTAVTLGIQVVAGAPKRVEYLIDGAAVGAAETPPFAFAWTPPRAGSVRIEARAIDAQGRTGLADALLASVAPAAAATLAIALTEPAPDHAYSAPASVALSARVDGAADRVEYYQGEAKIAEADRSPYAASWTRVPAGTYQVTARARRGDRVATSTPVTVVVAAPAAQPPSVRLDSPSDFDFVAENGKPTLRARATAKDGAITRVEFWADGKRLGEKPLSPYDFPWAKPAPGEHIVTAVAIDERGARTESEPVLLFVGRKAMQGLVRAVAFGLDPVELDGWRFTPLPQACADGFNVGNGKVVDAAKPPAGDIDPSLRALTAHVLVSEDEQLRFSQALPDGFYQVYAYVTDPGDGPGSIDLELEGAHTPSCKVAKAAWSRCGPFNVRVADGALNVVATRRGGARLCGLAILGALREPPPPPAHGCVWERWDGVGNLADLRRNVRFPAQPNADGPGDALVVVDQPRDVGVRASMWIVPPQTGNYRFWIACDDIGELWLGSDDVPAKMTRIARTVEPTNRSDWMHKPEQQSGEILLLAGHRYPLQALMWGGPQPNHVEVRWRLPDGTVQEPIPVEVTQRPAFAGIADVAKLAEAATARARAEETRVAASTATTNAPGAAGAIRVEYWPDVAPMSCADAWRTAIAARPPAQVRYASAFATESDRSDHYAARVRGALKPPTSGSYVFSLDCDDEGELWLAPADQPTAATLIAATTRAKARSAPIALDAAKTYLLEARLTENDLSDWCRVGWTLPDGHEETPIPAARFVGAAAPAHGLKREVWRGVPGNLVDDLINHPSYGGAPTHVEWLPGATVGEDGDAYGARLTGWIVAPQTGVFRFRMTVGDDARIYVGHEDRTPFPGVVKPHVHDGKDGWVDAGGGRFEAGQKYWIEILHKQFGPGDHLSLGWVLPDGTTQQPIDPQWLVPAP